MTANAGYHAYATGDVLTAAQVQYNLQNQTTMYFASASARTTALSGVLVEGMVSYIPANGIEYYNGSAWVSISQAVTALTTKGDLLTYSTQDTRLPVGSDGQTLVANSAATTGLQWQAPVQQNPFLNSAFQVWQRGTTSASITSTATYTADRWNCLAGATTATTVSRQVTGDTTNLPNIQYCARVQRTAAQTGTSTIQLAQSFESINSIPFAGKAITLSFYARAGANFSAASSALNIALNTGTGTDQQLFSGFTGAAYPIYTSATLTTTWQRFTYTATLATNITQIGLNIYYVPVGTAGANDYFEVTGVQLEVGSVATPFHTFSTTLQGELAACQRYYYRQTGQTYLAFTIGSAYSTSGANAYVALPVSMRTIPSAVEYSGIALNDTVSVSSNATSVTLSATESSTNMGKVNVGCAAVLTQYRTYCLGNAGVSTGYLGFTAEL